MWVGKFPLMEGLRLFSLSKRDTVKEWAFRWRFCMRRLEKSWGAFIGER